MFHSMEMLLDDREILNRLGAAGQFGEALILLGVRATIELLCCSLNASCISLHHCTPRDGGHTPCDL